METFEQPKITGYRQLSAAEVAQMNAVKELSEEVGRVVGALRQNPTLDQRWVSEGATDLQKGFMSLVRSIAQPTTF